MRPSERSRLRANLVNRRTLARVGPALGIAPHIRLGNGEEGSGGRMECLARGAPARGHQFPG